MEQIPVLKMHFMPEHGVYIVQWLYYWRYLIIQITTCIQWYLHASTKNGVSAASVSEACCGSECYWRRLWRQRHTGPVCQAFHFSNGRWLITAEICLSQLRERWNMSPLELLFVRGLISVHDQLQSNGSAPSAPMPTGNIFYRVQLCSASIP